MLKNAIFKRRFSMTMYKNRRLYMGEMSFTKDFVNDTRGNLYPIIDKSNDCIDRIVNNRYHIVSGKIERFVGTFFPFATYETDSVGGNVGFSFGIKGCKATVTADDTRLLYSVNGTKAMIDLPFWVGKSRRMLVSCRPGAFDVYFTVNNEAKFFHTIEAEAFADSNKYEIFSDGYAALYAESDATINSVCFYIDCGISQADMRPIRYENGDIMTEGGKVYLTMSIRMQEKMFQGIFSWLPGTAYIELTGALFYDIGDGRWCGDVAASVLYHRAEKMWYLWVCSFNHGHILAHSCFKGDIRFGVNVVDITLAEHTDSSAPITDFTSRPRDEDPDFYYDSEEKKWYMAICRHDPSINAYRYVFFESERPFDGYRYIGCGKDGAETGGSFVTVEDKKYFICGNDFKKTSDYRIYSEQGMFGAHFDYPDGGFRGWGTLMPIKLGSRTRYFWMTFDRHNGSDYNWSYGNIYCFEATIWKQI